MTSSLSDPAVRAGVARLLSDAVDDGAALGWVQAPGVDELEELLGAVEVAGTQGEAAYAVAVDDDGRVIGFGYWRRHPRATHRPHADLERLVVAAGRRGEGVGRGLLRRLVEQAVAAAVETLTLDVRGDNTAAIGLYASEGFETYGVLADFVAVGERRWDKVLMARRLRGRARATPSATQVADVAPAVEEATDHLVAWLVLQRRDGRVLLARRADVSYGAGLWGLPGGHVEDDESLAAGAARELREEVGVAVEPSDLEPCGVTRYVDGRLRGTDFFFRARRWQGEASPLQECSQVGWFDPQELPDDALPWLARALRRHLVEDVWLDDHPATG